MTGTPAAAAQQRVTAAVSISGVTVRFGDLVAVDDVSLDLEAGRIHALVGQNGAGKTTLARAVMGLIRPDAGSVHVGGVALHAGDVAAARAAGVDMVHQSFTLPPSFTVAEALELFDPAPRRAGYRMTSIERRWKAILGDAGVEVPPGARIRDLPIESLQAIEIVRAMASGARILILDEPTAVLPPPAVQRLFARLRSIRDSGVTVLVVLHKVREVLDIAETVSVLRAGRLVLPPTDSSGLTPARLSSLITGSADPGASEQEAATIESSLGLVEGPGEAGAVAQATGAAADGTAPPVLELRGIATEPLAAEAGLRDLSLRLHPGEILGIAGVEGNGQRSLVGVVTGLQPATAGTILIGGEDVTHRGARARRVLGLRVVPFDRNTEGVSTTSPIWENVAVREILMPSRRTRLLDLAALRRSARRALEDWHVVFRGIDQRAGELSGGNVQRLIFARELGGTVRLMIAAQPTRGLDVAATAFVHETLRGLRVAGAGVLLVSSDLDELLSLSDRVVVLFGGRAEASFAAPFDLARIGAAMVGAVA